MAVEQTYTMDRFRQMKAENDRLKEEMAAFRTRLGNATEDYVSPPMVPRPNGRFL